MKALSLTLDIFPSCALIGIHIPSRPEANAMSDGFTTGFRYMHLAPYKSGSSPQSGIASTKALPFRLPGGWQDPLQQLDPFRTYRRPIKVYCKIGPTPGMSTATEYVLSKVAFNHPEWAESGFGNLDQVRETPCTAWPPNVGLLHYCGERRVLAPGRQQHGWQQSPRLCASAMGVSPLRKRECSRWVGRLLGRPPLFLT